MRAAFILMALGACEKTAPAPAVDLAHGDDARIEALERRVAALEERVRSLPSSAMAPALPSPEDEQAAAMLLKQAQEAVSNLENDEARSLLAKLREQYGQTRAARAAQRIESEVSVVGRPEGELAVQAWYQGGPADLEGGRATLWVFWEVWCPHCKREVPKLTGLYDRYHDRGLRLAALTKRTRNVTEGQVREFISMHELDFPVGWEEGSAMSEHYGIRGIPAAAVTKNGVVVWRGHPAQLTDEMFERFLE